MEEIRTERKRMAKKRQENDKKKNGQRGITKSKESRVIGR
jgi:hypothetical protein